MVIVEADVPEAVKLTEAGEKVQVGMLTAEPGPLKVTTQLRFCWPIKLAEVTVMASVTVVPAAVLRHGVPGVRVTVPPDP